MERNQAKTLPVHAPLRTHIHAIIDDLRRERNVAGRRLIAIGAGIPLVALSLLLMESAGIAGLIAAGWAIGWALAAAGFLNFAFGAVLIYRWGRRLPADGAPFEYSRNAFDRAADKIDEWRHPKGGLGRLPKIFSLAFLAWRMKKGLFSGLLNRRS